MLNASVSPEKSDFSSVDAIGEPTGIPAPKVHRRFEGLATFDDRGNPGFFIHHTVIHGETETPSFEPIDRTKGLALVEDWVKGKGMFAPRPFRPRKPVDRDISKECRV